MDHARIDTVRRRFRIPVDLDQQLCEMMYHQHWPDLNAFVVHALYAHVSRRRKPGDRKMVESPVVVQARASGGILE